LTLRLAIRFIDGSRPPALKTSAVGGSHPDDLTRDIAARREEACAKVTEYVGKLFQAGEKDPHRLAACGRTCLRELDGSTDPVKACFTGL
jgi:hypothetical protein